MDGTKKMISPRFSRQIRIVSYWSMIAVVFIHAYNYTDVFLQPTTRISEGLLPGAMIEFFLSNALTRFATPVFFIISGYLFFAGVREFTATLYLRKIRSRVLSLAVPYVFWVLLWSMAGLLLKEAYGASGFPLIEDKLGGWPEKAFEGFCNDPLPFQFWYFRDLLKLTLISPLIWLLAVKLKKYAVVLFALPWLMGFSVPCLPSPEGLLFFMTGAVLAVSGEKEGLLSESRPGLHRLTLLVPLGWVAVCAAYTLLSAGASSNPVSDLALSAMYYLCVILGVLSVFILCEFLPEKIRGLDESRLPSSTVLLFALHEPLQHLIFQGALINGGPDSLHLLLYFGLPAVISLLAGGINRLLKRYAPHFRAFLTGGR